MAECVRIAIAGSRAITDYNALIMAIEGAKSMNIIPSAYRYEIISGGAVGVDMLARRYALEWQLPLIELKPQYNGPKDPEAPLRRNKDIADKADILIAVWNGISTGTAHMISCMHELHKPYYIHKV